MYGYLYGLLLGWENGMDLCSGSLKFDHKGNRKMDTTLVEGKFQKHKNSPPLSLTIKFPL